MVARSGVHQASGKVDDGCVSVSVVRCAEGPVFFFAWDALRLAALGVSHVRFRVFFGFG